MQFMILFARHPDKAETPASESHRTAANAQPTAAYIMWSGSPYAHVHIMRRP